MEFNLADLFELVVDTVPGRLAVVSGDRRLTYSDLDRRANRLAHRLAAAGVGPDDAVGLQLVNGPEYLEGMLACFKLRAVPVNINYRYVDAELRHLYADAGLVGLIHHRQFAAMVGPALEAMADPRVVLEVDDDRGLPPSAWAEDYEAALRRGSDERPRATRSGDDLYCVYTGGTTGAPKGVLWRQEDIFFAAMGGGDPLQLATSSRRRPSSRIGCSTPAWWRSPSRRSCTRARTGSRSRRSTAAARSSCYRVGGSTRRRPGGWSPTSG